MGNAGDNLSKRLQQLSERLVNITRRNKSIRLLRKAKRQCIDLFEIDTLSPGTAEEAVKQVLRGKDSNVLSWKDSPVDPRDERYELLIDERDELEEVETPEFKRVRLFKKLDANLTQLSRNARQIEEETGAVDLYLGYPWIIGNCDDTEGTFLQAPVMLFPVRLVAQRSPRLEWVLEARSDAEPIFNEALALALEQFHETKFSEELVNEVEEAAASEEASRDPAWLIDWLHAKLTEVGLRMSDSTTVLSSLPEYKAEQVPRATGAFALRAHAVVGYFPQAGSSLRRDYELLIEKSDRGGLEGVLGRLLDSSVEGPESDHDGQVTSMDEVQEADTCWIMSSDASQESAMLRSRTEDCLVVHGPPGTGKSQVICNLVSDALSRGERVVICCQKRAALDVVFQRLSAAGLSDHVAVVHDHANDRAPLYQRIATTLEEQQEEHAHQLETEGAQLAQSIDKATSVLSEIARELHKERRCGHTARELYAQAAAIADDQDQDILRAAGQFDRNSLREFLDRVELLADLNSRLSDRASAWSGRKSFGQLTFADRGRIDEALVSALESAKALIRAESAITDARPAASKAAGSLEALKALSAINPSHVDSVVAGLTRELMDASAMGTAKAALEATSRLLPQLKALPSKPGPEFAGGPPELAVSLETWLGKRTGLFRVFSGTYRTAKKKAAEYVAREGLTLSAEVVAEHAAMIRSQQQWNRLSKATEGSLLQPLIVGVSTADQVESTVGQLRSAVELSTLVKGLLQQAEIVREELLNDGDSLQAISFRSAKLAALGESFRLVKGATESLTEFLRDEAVARLVANADQDASVVYGLFERLRAGLGDFDTLQSIDDVLDKLRQVEAAVYRHVRKKHGAADWRRTIEGAVKLGWLAEVEKEASGLRRVSSGEIGNLRIHFKEQLDRRRELNKKRLALRLHRRGSEVRFEPGRDVDKRHSAEKPWRDLKHQVNKRRRLWPLRKLVHDLSWPLLEVVPCWLVSPETLSAAFPLQPGLFDLAIFDEASQLAVQYGLPAFYRAKRIVIAGDEQQLRPFDLFGALGVQTDLEGVDMDEDASAVEAESMLTLAKTRFPEVVLNCHYRSKYEELIEFSNQGFYQGRLMTVPPADGIDTAPISWKKVEGRWENRRNAPEAAAVLELLFEQMQQYGTEKSFGIITFNNTQQEEIKDQIDRRKAADPEFAALIALEENPESGKLDDAIFVKNIENVQGDERDVIIFSIGYAPDATGRVYNRFGTLGQEGGDNRLNVAISRAKERIFVVSSIEPEDLNVSGSTHRGPQLLRRYLEYARAVSSQAVDTRDAVLRHVNPALDVRVEKTGQFDSPLEEQVYDELTRRNLVVKPQVGVSGYRIDLGVLDPSNPSRYLLGIECDGATYHSARSVRERDAYRQRFLESRGWIIHRIWSRNWWRNRSAEMDSLMEAIAKAKNAAPADKTAD
ncbi:MAG: DUF4011 domain-containing protein [Planctomycetes bacterium]|nr:DUF4011 domain-containing protein [Planctomycetota bacterium]